MFLAATDNWIYLPLPIVQALYGAPGVGALLLINVGAQIVLWTVEVATLRGGRIDREAALALATNPGLLATAGGIGAALYVPHHVAMPLANVGGAVFDGVSLLGSLTTPLSLLVTGAQLGGVGIPTTPIEPPSGSWSSAWALRR